jgi:uncharacterized protein YlxW (UPF0749 family)
MAGHQGPGRLRRAWAGLRGSHGERGLAWRVAVPLVCALAGLLATTSMVNAKGTDLRGGRSSDLVDIVAAQRADEERLSDEISELQDEIEALTAQVGGSRLERIEKLIAGVAVSAGTTGLEGPALAVSLDDAPLDEEIPEGLDPNLLVVHQQDIQAVVNALWAGGAEGMTLQGQRIISTTGIKCVGNTVLLHGVPYSPPYDIVAIGNPSEMYGALLESPSVQAYRLDADEFGLGWSVSRQDDVAIPAFEGTLSLTYAKVPGEDG